MKRFLVSLLVMLLISVSALADLPDFSSMSYEELFNYKQALDAEYNSRPESAGIYLFEGDTYVAGRDIMPGRYYLAMVKPCSYPTHNTFYGIYDSMESREKDAGSYKTENAKDTGFLYLGHDPIMIYLNEGEVLFISSGSAFIKASEYKPSDYYTYEQPEGTLIPAGKYTAGVEIPAGSYTVYAGTVDGGVYIHRYLETDKSGNLKEKTGYENILVYTDPQTEKLELSDGDILEVRQSIIMKKPTQFTFN